jgi:hypothetical protein
MKRKLFSLLIICITLLLMFTLQSGCSKQSEDENTPPPDVSPSPTPTPTPSPTPSPTPPPVFVNGLNGETGEEDPNLKRPYAVMLNNIQVAQPQCGVSKADIIYEILAEGGVTRMIGIFYDVSGAGNLGSMRSARPYYIDIAQGYGAIFVHAGGSDQAYSDISSNGIDTLDGVRGVYDTEVFFRDPSRMAGGIEHSMFTTDERIGEAVASLGYRTEHDGSRDYGIVFAQEAVSVPDGGEAANITVSFSGLKETKFILDAGIGDYTLKQYGAEYIDGNSSAAPRFENVVVIYAEHKTLDSAGRLGVTLVGGGEGYFVNGGKQAEITWSRTELGGVFSYAYKSGKSVEFGAGKTFICVVPTDSKVTFE